MRFAALFRKTVLENLRDWKILSLTLLFAPFFVLLMYFYMTGASQTYVLLVINHDVGVSDGNLTSNAGDQLIAAMTNAGHTNDSATLEVREVTDLDAARQSLIDKTADLVIEIPANFSQSLDDFRSGTAQTPAVIRTTGNPSDSKYVMAASYSDLLSYTFAAEATGAEVPLAVDLQTVTGSVGDEAAETFDQLVPGLLVLSLMMLMFTAAASVIREKDKGTITRLLMSRMSAFDFLSSISLAQIIIGIAALGLTFLTAIALGYHAKGSLVVVLVICILCTLSIIGISLIVAAFLRSIFDLMTIGCFPFFVLMFFSGGMFPLPEMKVLEIAGHAINVNDVLPTTPAIAAMNKVLTYGAGLDGIAFELLLLALLTVVYFAAGLWLFRRRYLRTV